MLSHTHTSSTSALPYEECAMQVQGSARCGNEDDAIPAADTVSPTSSEELTSSRRLTRIASVGSTSGGSGGNGSGSLKVSHQSIYTTSSSTSSSTTSSYAAAVAASFLSTVALNSHSHHSKYDPDCSTNDRIDLREMESHLTFTMNALVKARRKFLIQALGVIVTAILSLTYYIYSSFISGASSRDTSLSLLLFGFCAIIILINIASGTVTDRLSAISQYQASMNRWLVLFGVQWKPYEREGERMKLEEIPRPKSPSSTSTNSMRHRSKSHAVASRNSNNNYSANPISTSTPSSATPISDSMYEQRKQSGIESGWINNSPVPIRLDETPTPVALGAPILSAYPLDASSP